MSSIYLIPAITVCRNEIFFKSIVAHTKTGHVSKTTPLLGVIFHPFGKTWYNIFLYKIWNVSCDVTTPLSGTVFRPSAWTSYYQPVHQIWSLCVYSVWRYERRLQFRHDLWHQKTKSPEAIMWHYLAQDILLLYGDHTFSRFDTIPECDRYTHTHTDKRRRHISCLA